MASHWRRVSRGSAFAVCVMMLGASAGASSGAAPTIAAAGAPQAVTCFATGEQTSGMNKICYYDCLGSSRAVTQSSVSLCALSITAPMPGASMPRPPRPPQPPMAGQVTCFGQGERTSGMNKICYYDCLGSSRAITQSSVSLCPLTIRQ